MSNYDHSCTGRSCIFGGLLFFVVLFFECCVCLGVWGVLFCLLGFVVLVLVLGGACEDFSF